MKWHFVVIAGLLAVAQGFPATLTVTTIADSGPGSLREAIEAASSGDTICFSVSGTIALTTGPLPAVDGLTIAGPGAATLAIDAGLNSPIFHVVGGSSAISNLTLSRGFAGSLMPELSGSGGAISNSGTLTLRDCVLAGNLAFGGGGALLNLGVVFAADITFTGNVALAGGALAQDSSASSVFDRCAFSGNVADADGDGGAIHAGGTSTFNNCVFERNQAGHGDGGAIYSAGLMTVSQSVFRFNSAMPGWNGGGAVNNHGTLYLLDSRLERNNAVSAGALWTAGTSIVQRSTIQGNSSFHGAQGIAVHGGSLKMFESTISDNAGQFNEHGGGMYVHAGAVALTNCTISGNVSSTGAGIQNFTGDVALDSCTVTRNFAYNEGRGLLSSDGSFRLRNTIVAENGPAGSQNGQADVWGPFISGGHNLIGIADGSTGLTNGLQFDQVGTILIPLWPGLGPLQDNGGPTWTHNLLSGSPAIDKGLSGVLAMDQRGFPRVVDGLFVLNNGDGADIGAVEAEKLLTDIVIDGSDVRVRFPTFLGNTYAVEFSTVLAAGNWTALPNLIGTGSYASVTHVNGATLPQVFYRLSCPP